MFNLLAYRPDGGRERYFGYMQAFAESVGSRYGGEPIAITLGVTDWTGRGRPQHQGVDWEDAALIYYPSIWHFAKMLDDSEYAEADFKYKQGSLRDGALLCCIEINI